MREIIKTNKEELSLNALVTMVSNNTGYGKERIEKRIMQMQTEGKIRLEENTPFLTLVQYALSPETGWFWGAMTATLLSAVLIFVNSGAGVYLRYVFGGALILFLPGYSLLQYLYARKRELDDLTRVALSVGLSLAIVPLTGLVLNYTPFGIRLLPVEFSLCTITIVFLLLGLQKRHAYYKLAKDLL